jgi:phosphoribosylglycinamide formyltransferase-1
MTRARVGVLISGRGSNMAALVEAARQPTFPAEVSCVVSNRADAAGLAFAAQHGIPTQVIDHTTFASRTAFDQALNAYLTRQNLDIIACAGFMRVLGPDMLKPWAGRIINIHPSLLPLYKGLHTHERALADGVPEHGCSVHHVSEELDGGEVILQAKVPVLAGDTAESLAARVLVEEHTLYPRALAVLARQLAQLKTSS